MNSTAPISWKNALVKYAKGNLHRRAASGKRLAQARYANDSHVTVTYATLNGIPMRIERSLMWGIITKPCKEQA